MGTMEFGRYQNLKQVSIFFHHTFTKKMRGLRWAGAGGKCNGNGERSEGVLGVAFESELELEFFLAWMGWDEGYLL